MPKAWRAAVTSTRWAHRTRTNITLIEDNVHSGFDVSYTMDDVDRLTRAQEGTWGGSSISSETRDQEWTLDHVGNWDLAKLDLNGDGDWSDTDEYEDDRTHNKVNELTGRDIDDSGSDDYTLVYDEVGNLVDDGESYKYVYDPMGRLREVLDRSDDSLVAEYKYNGLKYRVSEHVDTDDDGDVDGSDDLWHYAFDTRWRVLSKYVGSASDPEEEYVYQRAGRDGRGGSSYIDELALRERDTTGNGTLDERIYYCQNWRADVSALVDGVGAIDEWVKYSAYGVPFGLPGGDTDSDGDCDSTDEAQVTTWVNASAYDVRGDADIDGDLDAQDQSLVSSAYSGANGGWYVISPLSYASNRGRGGLRYSVRQSCYTGRARRYLVKLGRWGRRDSLEYADGSSLYQALRASPVVYLDPGGEYSLRAGSGAEQTGPAGGVGGDVMFNYGFVSARYGEGLGYLDFASRPTNDECCEAALAANLDDCFKPDDDGGLVYCAGKRIACSFYKYRPGNQGDPNRPGEGVGHGAVSKCIRGHEGSHLRREKSRDAGDKWLKEGSDPSSSSPNCRATGPDGTVMKRALLSV